MKSYPSDPEAEVLGRILLMQSALQAAPDERRLAEVLVHGLEGVPGIAWSVLCIDRRISATAGDAALPAACRTSLEKREPSDCCRVRCPMRSGDNTHWFALKTNRRVYGCLMLQTADQTAFEPYAPYITHTAGLAALHIENSRISAELRSLNLNLEAQVAERTASLRKSEEHYRSLFDNMLNGFAYCKMLFQQDRPKEFIYLDVNSAFKTLTGLKDVVGKKVSEVIPNIRESDPQLFEVYGRVALTGIPERFETYVAALGMWFSISVYSPQREHFVSIFDVITERKQAEAALLETSARLSVLFDHARDAMIVADVGTGIIQEANREAEKLLGRRREEIVGLHFTELHPPQDADKYRDVFRRHILSRGRPPLEVEIERPDGSRIPVEFSSNIVILGNGQRVLQGVLRDITRRKVSEQALRESEERLSLALTASQMGIWEWDLRTDAVFWSLECYKIFGIENFGGTLQSVMDLVHPEDVARVVTACREAVAERTAYAQEFRAILPDGGVRWLSGFGRVQYDEQDTPLRLVGIMQDITARKKAEDRQTRAEAQLRQAQKMESLGTLAGGIAHDFNNILGVIVGYTEIALWETCEGSPLRRNLQEVLKAANRAAGLVKQILAFSRRREQEKKPLLVRLIVKEALKLLRASLPSTIEIQSDVSSKAVVQADPTQIHQVLMNLCTNAAHAMQDNGGILDVSLADVHLGQEFTSLHPGLQPGLYVRLEVKDTGQGIDPALLDRIFDPFFTTKGPGVGTGLGLAVVHGIVTSHGGTIQVESLPGKGTSFHVFFPATENVALMEKVDLSPLPRGQERILVVDDEPALAMATKHMLERLGYETEYRTNSVEALETFHLQWRDKPFDLVITDMTMPNLTGVDLARELHRFQPTLPIILCTGFSEKIDDRRARSLGIRAFLMKPFVLRELAELVRKLLEKR